MTFFSWAHKIKIGPMDQELFLFSRILRSKMKCGTTELVSNLVNDTDTLKFARNTGKRTAGDSFSWKNRALDHNKSRERPTSISSGYSCEILKARQHKTSEHLAHYISMMIQTNGFEDDIVENRIRWRNPRRTFTGELGTWGAQPNIRALF